MVRDFSKPSWKKPVDLGQSLADALKKREQAEQEYRDTNQRYWTIMFIDVSTSAKKLWDLGEAVVDTVLSLFHSHTRAVLDHLDCCFIEPGGGPMVVCCFENPAQALIAADAVQRALAEWNKEQDELLQVMPAIGVHQGYVHYYDDIIHQSNTNNMAKRIQTEAGPGQIFISSHLYEALKRDLQFKITYNRTANLKNIPEPQDIYEVQVQKPVTLDLNFLTRKAEEMALAAKEPCEDEDVEEVGVDKKSFHWAIVYIDVCESTKKFWKYGDREARQLIKDYQELCHKTFKEMGCDYVESSEGDQIFAGFEMEKMEDSVNASIKILQGLFRRNTSLSQHKQVRAAIGIHSGEVLFQGKDLVQTKDMRLGKTIQGEAGADDILVSGVVYEVVSPDLQGNMEWMDTVGLSGSDEVHDMYNLKWFNLRTSVERPTLGRSIKPGPTRFGSR